ncbi:hypothetical protein ACFLXH_03470, partial [Chloroflexota bacterium]
MLPPYIRLYTESFCLPFPLLTLTIVSFVLIATITLISGFISTLLITGSFVIVSSIIASILVISAGWRITDGLGVIDTLDIVSILVIALI